MISHHRNEAWVLPGGRRAEVVIECHSNGDEVVPLMYELFEQMVTDLGFKRDEGVSA